MAKSKHKTNKKLSTRMSLADSLFIDRKIRGCEAQMLKIENKLVKLKSKTGLMKIVVMKEVEQLTRSYNDYQRLLKHLECEKTKQMHRSAIYQDAFEDIKEGFAKFSGKLNISQSEEVIQETEESIHWSEAEERIHEIYDKLVQEEGIYDYDILAKRCALEGISLE